MADINLDHDRSSLTFEDKEAIFRIAAASLPKRYAREIEAGMTDEALSAALSSVLGIFGGSYGPDQYSITYTGSGLRIWGGWHVVNHVTEAPLFAGKATIAMARQTYGISDPEQKQMELF